MWLRQTTSALDSIHVHVAVVLLPVSERVLYLATWMAGIIAIIMRLCAFKLNRQLRELAFKNSREFEVNPRDRRTRSRIPGFPGGLASMNTAGSLH